MPMPMLAARIMGTSLAPSPTPRARHPGTNFLTSRTMSAFWSGLERHTTTERHWVANSTNLSAASLRMSFPEGSPSKMKFKVAPSTTRPCLSSSDIPAASCRHSASLEFTSSSEVEFRTWSFMLGVSKLVERPISIAVSCLSPVSTHSLMFARASRTMVSGTFACSLSSTAVHPTRPNPPSSTSLASVSNFTSRSAGGSRVAASHFALHVSCSLSFRVFCAKQSVRRPSME
mmetsp:Transcript_3440/g.6329  ORF Transcript_3440/g.6329 Transcript_3440/m.6329 type:complete len:231 (-) Transcript_3440:2002-2694(-)